MEPVEHSTISAAHLNIQSVAPVLSDVSHVLQEQALHVVASQPCSSGAVPQLDCSTQTVAVATVSFLNL